jgi:hypothetical protein
MADLAIEVEALQRRLRNERETAVVDLLGELEEELQHAVTLREELEAKNRMADDSLASLAFNLNVLEPESTKKRADTSESNIATEKEREKEMQSLKKRQSKIVLKEKRLHEAMADLKKASVLMSEKVEEIYAKEKRLSSQRAAFDEEQAILSQRLQLAADEVQERAVQVRIREEDLWRREREFERLRQQRLETLQQMSSNRGDGMDLPPPPNPVVGESVLGRNLGSVETAIQKETAKENEKGKEKEKEKEELEEASLHLLLQELASTMRHASDNVAAAHRSQEQFSGSLLALREELHDLVDTFKSTALSQQHGGSGARGSPPQPPSQSSSGIDGTDELLQWEIARAVETAQRQHRLQSYLDHKEKRGQHTEDQGPAMAMEVEGLPMHMGTQTESQGSNGME